MIILTSSKYSTSNRKLVSIENIYPRLISKESFNSSPTALSTIKVSREAIIALPYLPLHNTSRKNINLFLLNSGTLRKSYITIRNNSYTAS